VWRLIWAENALEMEEMRNAYKNLVGKPEGKRQLEDLDTRVRIILKHV
jgi:hypothetical protein